MVPSTPQAMRREIQFAGELTTRILGRWSQAWREVLASALGAALAWVLAERLLGHPQPIFAAISAIVCLAPGLPSHTKQTKGLLLGVGTGIVVGELILTLPDIAPLLEQFEGVTTKVRPAHETIIFARKPTIRSVAENTVRHGVGGVLVKPTRTRSPDGRSRSRIHLFSRRRWAELRAASFLNSFACLCA